MTDTTSPKIHSAPVTVAGAVAGGLAMFFVADREKVPARATVTAFGAVLGGLIFRELTAKPNPDYIIPPPPPTPIPPSGDIVPASGGARIVVTPGLSAQTVPLNVQDPVVIALPPGAQWISLDGAGLSDTTSPYAFIFLGPINHVFVWQDANRNQYVSTFFFVVNPSPTTNA
jgi:hypothetical protein